MLNRTQIVNALDQLIRDCNINSVEKGFWEGQTFATHGPEKIALMHSELSEALEAMRVGNYHAPHGVCEELADTVIRIFDYAGMAQLDLAKMILDKMARNRERPRKHGKLF